MEPEPELEPEPTTDSVILTVTPIRTNPLYRGKEATPTPPPSKPERLLAYEDLRSTRSLDGLDGSPDRIFDVTLSGGMRSSADGVTFDFLADNSGKWLFYCYFFYYLERGMAHI